MATPLRKVSEDRGLSSDLGAGANRHFFPPPSYDDFAEAMSENKESPHANPILVRFSVSLAGILSHIVRGGVENGSRTSFTPFPLESILPPGRSIIVTN